MYKFFARPHLDYCDGTYHLPPHQQYATTFFNLQHLMTSVESTQCPAACAVLGAWKGTNISMLYKEMGREHLSLTI